MPYPSGHRDKVRKKIIQSARKLFNRSGFEKVSVNQIMAETGLTRGGFYSYFESKSDLYAEVLSCFLTDPSWNNTWEGVDIDLRAAQVGPQIVCDGSRQGILRYPETLRPDGSRDQQDVDTRGRREG
jgi:AcrR family transcriptional regulator